MFCLFAEFRLMGLITGSDITLMVLMVLMLLLFVSELVCGFSSDHDVDEFRRAEAHVINRQL